MLTLYTYNKSAECENKLLWGLVVAFSEGKCIDKHKEMSELRGKMYA